MVKSKTILCIADYYLPASNAGGSVESLSNLITNLGKNFNFLVITRDRDLLSPNPYSNVLLDQWNVVGNARVFYASPSSLTLLGIFKLIRRTEFDILYLNSFFSFKMTFYPTIINWFNNKYMIIISPKGEFSPGAMKFKAIRKYFYIKSANILNLFANVTWHASSSYESDCISKFFHSNIKKIFVAPDLPYFFKSGPVLLPNKITRKTGPLRIIFLSRISPVKNIVFLLKLLQQLDISVTLNIYGPVEDLKYWNYCKSLIMNLPQNISVFYKGKVDHNGVHKIFSMHDIFIFPTLGENFSHVIYESLASGTPVFTSNLTFWQEGVDGVLDIASLNDPKSWIDFIKIYAELSPKEFLKKRKACLDYVKINFNHKEAVSLNRELFSQPNFYL